MSENNPLTAKRDALLSTTLDDQQVIAALKLLKEQYPKLDVMDSMDQIRSVLERDVQHKHEQFLEAYDHLLLDLSAFEDEVNVLLATCTAVEESWKSTHQHTQDLFDKTHQLEQARQQTELRLVTVKAFVDRFTLSNGELTALTEEEGLSEEFFQAYKKLQTIQHECETYLLPTESRVADDVLNYTTDYQEAANTKLLRGTQHEYRQWDPEAPEVTPALRGAMLALRHKPALFQICVEDISSARRLYLRQAFTYAMTEGPRPLELLAHDQQRYVGEMLAWLHQNVMGERELWNTLFSLDNDGPPHDMPQMADKNVVCTLIDVDLSELLEPFRMRIDAVLDERPGVIIEYKLAQLLLFYSLTIAKVIGKATNVYALLDTLVTESFDIFAATLQETAENLLRFPEKPNDNLLPCNAVKESGRQIEEIVEAYATSMVQESEESDPRRPGFDAVLGRMIGPLLQMCALGASDVLDRDRAIYMINCLESLQVSLGTSPSTMNRRDALKTEQEGYVHTLVQHEFDDVLIASGLFELARQSETESIVPFVERPQCEPEAVALALSRLDTFLFTSNLDVPPWLRALNDAKLASQVSRRALEEFVHAYQKVRTSLLQDTGYEELWRSGAVLRTVDELETLVLFD